jgi:NAD(P)-dependent dehydrogenase (short-subunit alcohol dehydrogenase family)
MTTRLSDRTAIITGAASGIGAALARRFCQEGAKVIGVDRDEPALRILANELELFDPVVADLNSESNIATLVDRIIAKHPRIDILINNAGIMDYARIDDTSFAQWQRIFAVNLEASFHLCRLVSKQMIANRYGRIINVSSTEALQAEPNVSIYAASKGGIIAFTRAIAVDLAPYGITANTLAPGCIHTPMSIVNGVDETTTPLFQEWYIKNRKIPLGRSGRPEEIAAAALFLASEESSYITGHSLVVDGGLTATF